MKLDKESAIVPVAGMEKDVMSVRSIKMLKLPSYLQHLMVNLVNACFQLYVNQNVRMEGSASLLDTVSVHLFGGDKCVKSVSSFLCRYMY